MDVFGLSAEQIDSAGAHWTAREICQQPQIWLDVERLMAAEADRLASIPRAAAGPAGPSHRADRRRHVVVRG